MAQPEKVFKQGCCSAAVFVNRVNKNGKTMEMRSVLLQKGYKDMDGQWKMTSSFGINELPKILFAAS
jgi:hypothetical protein